MNKQSKDLIAFLISQFEIELEPIALIKLVYLCEIEAIEKYGKRFTDLQFIHYKHGPYAKELQNSYESNDFVLSHATLGNPELLAVAETVLNTWKPRIIGGGIQGLINKTYHTLPFQESSYNEEINFEKYIDKGFISEMVVDKKQYEKLSNPNLKLYSSKNQELQSSIDTFLEQFN
jgi:hypothetical protein